MERDEALALVREKTEKETTVRHLISVEGVMRPLWRQFVFHNQTPLFFKRLLLFEPRVVVVSVPIHFE
jgi:hypothetical protein